MTMTKTISNPFTKNIYPTPTTIPYLLIFNNSGGMTLQTETGYTHFYESGESAAAAKDVCLIMQGVDPVKMCWDGDEPEYTYNDLNDLPAECDVYDADHVLHILHYPDSPVIPWGQLNHLKAKARVSILNFDPEAVVVSVKDFFTALKKFYVFFS